MPFYHRLGEVPRVKHTVARRAGGGLWREELFSSRGFSGPYSTRYHVEPPAQLLRAVELSPSLGGQEDWPGAPLVYQHLLTDRAPEGGDFVSARRTLLRNAQVALSVARPTAAPARFYRNAYASEYVFVHRGRGVFASDFGDFLFEEGDQIVVPRSVTWQLHFDASEGNKLLVVESRAPFEVPQEYRIGGCGQLSEAAPYSERDLKVPSRLEARSEPGEFHVLVKAGERLFEHLVPRHPFDVAGWDGYLYPFAINLRAFHPKVGRVHLPPPVHLLLRTEVLTLCNFVPRPFDFHPEAVPAPYYHSNVDSDEVLYYVEGDFMSRRGVGPGSLTLHPAGMPHGPQPGKIEESIGARETREYAVMVDAFEPLRPTAHARAMLDSEYPRSWLVGERDRPALGGDDTPWRDA